MSKTRIATSRCGRLLLSGMVIVALFSVTSRGAAGAEESTLDFLGFLEESPEANDAQRYVIDVDKDRLLYLWRRGGEILLNSYDTSSPIPRLEREKQIGTYDEFTLDYASPYTFAIDRKRDLGYFIGLSIPGTPIRVVDLRSFEVIGTWNLEQKIPGFFGEGITYSAEDDRLYIVGNFYGEMHGKVVSQLSSTTPAVGAIALDIPKQRDGAPELAWARHIPQCQYLLNTYGVGALIARGSHNPALYFGCVRPDPMPGESGLVRMWIDPKADLAAAQAFKVDYFPISGSYTLPTNGVVGTAAFDPKSERFFMQSVSVNTPGIWVFDGKLSSWVGFVAAPNSANKYIGIDPETGRLYMGSPSLGKREGYLLVTDGRATPIPQGRIYTGPSIKGFVSSDPASDRIFFRAGLKSLGLGEKGEDGFAVVNDLTPKPLRPTPIDYDELTSDLAEGPDAITDYSAGTNGYGARVVMVGGYGGVLSAAGVKLPDLSVRSGDRGFTAARLTSVDLRAAGSAATAQAFAPDLNSEGDLSDGAGQTLPWRIVSCLNGGGEAISDKDEQNNGSAAVECDLEKAVTTATASFGHLEADGLYVAGSSMRSVVRRDSKNGAVTETVSEAKGIELPTPQGSIAIAKVISTSTTVAHGHAKTAEAKWSRVISGVEVLGPDGTVVQRLGGCDSADAQDPCAPLAKQINDLLPQRLRVEFPLPDLQATSKGAFAGVHQSDADYFGNQTVNNQGTIFTGEEASRAVPAMQITVYNDTQEKSRLVVMLAAVQANSIYTISPAGDSSIPGAEIVPLDRANIGGGGMAPVTGTSGAVDFGDLGDPIDSSTEVGAPADTDTPVLAVQPMDGALAYLTRSPQEALLVGLLWLTFGAGGWTMFRRGRLLSVLRGDES